MSSIDADTQHAVLVRAAEAVQRTPRVMPMWEAMAFRNGAQPIGG